MVPYLPKILKRDEGAQAGGHNIEKNLSTLDGSPFYVYNGLTIIGFPAPYRII
jgi:hypothetical protein